MSGAQPAGGVEAPQIEYPEAFPTLRTERLLLREVVEGDLPAIRRWFGELEIARNTGTIPHPYPPEAADAFLERVRKGREARTVLAWAIELLDPASATPWFGGPLHGYIGGMGYHDISADHRRGELGYVLAKPAWGQGFASEATRAIVRYGFERLRLHRIYASYYVGNGASGRVLAKCGLRPEGLQRHHMLRFGEFRDSALVGAVREEWLRENG